MYLTYTICSDYHITTPLSYYQSSILCTLPTKYAPIIIKVLRKHIVCLTYTICSKYHITTEVTYCVPYLHNMLPLSQCNRGSILCTLPTQYAPIIIIPPRKHIVYLNYIICSEYHNTTEVAYCVPYLHNMLQL